MQPAAKIAARAGNLRSAIDMRGLLSVEYAQTAIGKRLHFVLAGDDDKLTKEAGIVFHHTAECR